MIFSSSLFSLLPVIAILVAKIAPSLVFPPAPVALPGSPKLLVHCKKIGRRYILVALVIALLVAGLALTVFHPPKVPLDSAPERIAHTLQLEVWPMLFYVFCIYRVAIGRTEDPKAVLGERTNVSSKVEIASRVLQNTTEQLLLGSLSHLILSTVISPTQAAAMPAMVALWMSGRVLFVLGYTPENPMAREFGFHLTMIPSLLCLSWSAFHLLAAHS